jgi:hypothetical protein
MAIRFLSSGNISGSLNVTGGGTFGGTLGVGGAASVELQVNASSGYAETRLVGASGSGGTLEFYNSTTKLADIYADPAKKLYFRTNGGTTALTLEADQDAIFAGNVNINKSGAVLRITDTAITNTSFNTLAIHASAQNRFSLGVSSTTGFVDTITIDGATTNVGIGTTSPDFTLDVEADKDTWLSRIYNTGSDANAQTLLVRSDATAAHNALVMGVYADSGYKMVVKSTGNVGIGTSTPSALLEIQTASTSGLADFQIFSRGVSPNYEVLKISRAAGSTEFLANQNLTLSADYDNNHTSVDSNIIFKTDNVEKMRIASDGVTTIGMTNNIGSAEVRIGGTGNATGNGTGRLNFVNSSSYRSWQLLVGGSAAGGLAFNQSVTFGSDDFTVERMRISSSGNVGIGTTLPIEKLQVSGQIISTGSNSTLNTSGAQRAIMDLSGFSATDTSARFGHFRGATAAGAGQMRLYTDSVERVRIDASGDVGIGITLPAKKLDVEGNIRAKNTAGTAAAEIDIASGATWRLRANPTSGTNSYGLDIVQGGSGSGVQMTITSQGKFGLGTDNPVNKLHVVIDDSTGGTANGALIEQKGTGDSTLSFLLTGVQRWKMGIDNSDGNNFKLSAGNNLSSDTALTVKPNGELLLGTSTSISNERLTIQNSSASQGIIIDQTDNASANDKIIFRNSNGVVGYIRTTNSQTAYVTSSDYRLKEDLQDFAGLDMVSRIPVYNFKWKSDFSRSYGVMAHELKRVLPESVSGEKDAEEMQGVDYSKIVPLLIKSIQELKEEIEILKNK